MGQEKSNSLHGSTQVVNIHYLGQIHNLGQNGDIETMADASVEQMDSSQNMDDSEDGWGPSWEDGPYYHPYFEHISDSD